LFVGSTNATEVISAPNTVNISGSGGATLLIANTNANILVGQGSTNGGALQRVTLNLSGLDYFTATVGRIGVAGKQTFPAGVIDATAGTMYLAKTNLITLASVPAVYSTNAIVNYPLVVGDTANAAKSGFNILYLGITNTFFVDGMAFGTYKSGSSGASGGSMLFNPAFFANNPVAVFRGVGGLSSRVTKWSIGDQNGQGGSNQDAGTNDFTGGTIDILVKTLTLGTDMTEGSSQIQRGVLNFTAGTIDANLILAGNQSAVTAGAGQGPCLGTINILGAAATLVVNTNIELGHTTLPATTVGTLTNSYGLLYISNGVANLNNLTVGAVSISNIVRIVNGTLTVSNALATNSAGLFALVATNATLGFAVPANGSLRSLVKTLTTGGATNVVQLAATPVIFSSYPHQIHCLGGREQFWPDESARVGGRRHARQQRCELITRHFAAVRSASRHHQPAGQLQRQSGRPRHVQCFDQRQQRRALHLPMVFGRGAAGERPDGQRLDDFRRDGGDPQHRQRAAG
jgi:hypothetical protein